MIIDCVVRFSMLIALFFPAVSRADESASAPASESYRKEKKILPGEEVITPTGQKLKVWSTEGGVPVSNAPEPFRDERSKGRDISVVIDGRSRPTRGTDDSFDVRSPR